MSQDNYIIDDLEEFTQSARKLVYNGFGKGVVEDPDEFTRLITEITPEEIEELNKILSQQEALLIVKNIAKEQKHKYKKTSRYIIDEKIFSDIIEAMNARLVSNILTNLASKGLIESAYDPEINDFVFWTTEDGDGDLDENPETD
jgi:hypothetical protein